MISASDGEAALKMFFEDQVDVSIMDAAMGGGWFGLGVFGYFGGGHSVPFS